MVHMLTPKQTKSKIPLLIVAFVLFWLPVIVFSKLASEVIEREPISLDIIILERVHMAASPFLDWLFLVFTTIGNVEYILPITVLLLIYLIYKKHRLYALILGFGVGGAAAANFILKLVFQRDRPAFWDSLIVETGYSFPSGHAMISSALILCIIVMLWSTRWRLFSCIVGGLVVLMIGLSRLYMGVHYPTDIIAGWSVSFVWVMIVVLLARGLSYEVHKKRNTIKK